MVLNLNKGYVNDNILEDWKLGVKAQISELAKHRNTDFNQAQIDFIYNTLKGFFPNDFFEIKPGFKNKTFGFDFDNWLNALLANDITGTVYQLLEFCLVIEHFSKQQPELLNNLKGFAQKKRFRQFRSEYFELFTFFILGFNRISTKLKPTEGKKELEGICSIDGQEFLFECQKLFMLSKSLSELTLIRNLDLEYTRTINDWSPEIPGMIISMVLGENDKFIKTDFIQILKSYPGKVSKSKGEDFLLAFPENSECPIITIRPYSMENKLITEHDLKGKRHNSFYRIPPAFIRPSSLNQTRITIQGSTQVSKAEMLEVLIKSIKKKRENRVDSNYRNRIYLFELENYPGIFRPLISHEQFDDSFRQEVQKYVDLKDTNDIIGLIFKDSATLTIPKVHVEFFCRKEFDHYKSYLNSMVWDIPKFLTYQAKAA